MRRLQIFAAVWLLVIFVPGRAAEENPAARVVLLANRDDPDSLRVARHYAEARGVPPENIFAFPLPLAEAISWREFVVALWQPLMEQLVRTKWIDATPMALTDPVGRQKFSV